MIKKHLIYSLVFQHITWVDRRKYVAKLNQMISNITCIGE